MTGWLTAYLLSAGLALGSSTYNLTHGCREMNPLMPSRPAVQIPVKMAITGGTAVGFAWVWGRAPRSGRLLFAVGTGVNLADASMNLLALGGCRQ